MRDASVSACSYLHAHALLPACGLHPHVHGVMYGSQREYVLLCTGICARTCKVDEDRGGNQALDDERKRRGGEPFSAAARYFAQLHNRVQHEFVHSYIKSVTEFKTGHTMTRVTGSLEMLVLITCDARHHLLK